MGGIADIDGLVASVCTENSILVDYVTESPNVSGDDRSVMRFFLTLLSSRSALTRFLLVILMIVKEASYLSLQRRCLLQIPDCTGAVEELALELRGNSIPAHKHGKYSATDCPATEFLTPLPQRFAKTSAACLPHRFCSSYCSLFGWAKEAVPTKSRAPTTNTVVLRLNAWLSDA